tara:strand:- start:4991 stop:5932 length:942 start_codon:yes stop_codon:yes gene_type:complete
MIHITYIPSSKHILASGHILFEIFTTFIFSMLLDIKPVWDDSWKKSLIITEESIKNNTETKLSKYDHVININNFIKWESITYQDFLNIKNLIEDSKKNYKNILITLSNVCVIHPDILCNWYNLKYISDDIYTLQAKPMLEKLYYYDHNNTPINTLAIHIRRGDIVQQCYDYGLTLDYYKNIINIINEHLNIQIHIYYEDGFAARNNAHDKNVINFNYDDILILGTLENVTLIKGKGTGPDFHKQFNELCRNKIVIMSPSSFSLWVGFITSGIVLVDKKCINCRPNLFRHSENIPNFIVFENFIDIIETLKKII